MCYGGICAWAYVDRMIHGFFIGSLCMIYFLLLLYLVSGNCYVFGISRVEQRQYYMVVGVISWE